MRSSPAGAVLVAVVAAFVVAAVVALGTGPLPDEMDAVLVELRTGPDGLPSVVVEDDDDGDLAAGGITDRTALVRPDQLICRGGSISDIAPGAPVTISGPGEVVVDSVPVSFAAAVVVVDCET